MAAIMAVAAIAACTGEPGRARTGAARAVEPPAELRAGDVVLRASAVQASALGAAIAARHGVDADPRTVLLVIGPRRVDGTGERDLPARVEAEVVDLLGRRRTLPLRTLAHGGFTDHVAELRVSPPETLRFVVRAEHRDGAPMRLAFTRDFLPPP